MTEVRALSLWQPWASLIALGVKSIETRSWPTAYRGRLLIHAAKRRPPDWWADALDLDDAPSRLFHVWRHDESGRYLYTWGDGPLGAVVASAVLADVVPMVNVLPKRDRPPGVPSHEAHDGLRLELRPLYSEAGNALTLCDGASGRDVSDQRPFGDFAPGRWAWLLEDVKATAERCPRCWGAGDDPEDFSHHRPDDRANPQRWCETCEGAKACEPVSMRGRQGLWCPTWEAA